MHYDYFKYYICTIKKNFMIWATFKNTNTRTLQVGFLLFILTLFITAIDFIVYLYQDIYSFADGISFQLWIYYALSALGYASLLAFPIVLLFYIIPSLMVKNKKIPLVLYTVIAVLLQVLAIVDAFVLKIYKFHLNAEVWEMITKAGNKIFVFETDVVVDSILLVIFLAIVPYVLVALLASKFYRRVNRRLVLWSILLLVVFNVVLFAGYCYGAINRGKNDVADNIVAVTDKLPLFSVFKPQRILSKYIIMNLDEVDRLIFDFHDAATMQYPLNPILTNDSLPSYNIVYIAIDSWNYTTYNADNTPNIYRFATDKGQYYAKHSSCANWTREGNFNLFFGLSSHYHEQTDNQNLSPLFIDRLIEQDYNIKLLVSAGFDWPPLDKSIFKRVKGIERNIDGATPFDRDNKITEEAIDYINKQNLEKPFFSYIFYDLPHAISIPEEYRNKYTPSLSEPPYTKLNNSMDNTEFFNLYKNCVYYTDSLISRVIGAISDRGLLDRTIIVITADHGQEFNENKKNYWGHGSNFSDWQTRVPLIIYYPGIKPGKVYSHQTSHFDVTPTIMNRFMGIRNPMSDYSMGVDLEDSVTSRYPLLYNGYYYYMGGYGFENMIIHADYTEGYSSVTDRALNKIPRDRVDVETLRKGIAKRDMFYRK